MAGSMMPLLCRSTVWNIGTAVGAAATLELELLMNKLSDGSMSSIAVVLPAPPLVRILEDDENMGIPLLLLKATATCQQVIECTYKSLERSTYSTAPYCAATNTTRHRLIKNAGRNMAVIANPESCSRYSSQLYVRVSSFVRVSVSLSQHTRA